jgi:Zn-dependent protease with chaperone function
MQQRSPFELASERVVRALALFGVLPGMVVAIVVALLVGPVVGLLALVVVAVGWAGAVVARANGAVDRVLRSTGAHPLGDDDLPRWHNVVDGMGVTSGVSDCELWVIEQEHANALSVAGKHRAALVVTRGLVEGLSVVELEGVAANLLGRVRDGSARYGTVTAGLLAPFLGKLDQAGRLVADGLGDQRSVRSDLVAVDMTRYPPGMADALAGMGRIGTVVPGAAPMTAHLWVAPVVEGEVGVDPAVAETAQQPLAYRIALLQEL